MKLTKAKLKKLIKEELKEANGMPSSVSKHKQKLSQMTDAEFAAQYGAKSENELRQMAWSHGYGKMSPHYWDRIKRITEKQIAQIKALILDAHNLYKQLPDKLKPYLIENFEMYAQRWRKSLEGTEEAEAHEEVPGI